MSKKEISKGKLTRTLEIPSGVSVSLSNGSLNVQGPNGQETASLPSDLVAFQCEDRQVTLNAKAPSKKAAQMTGTYFSIIRNLLNGVSQQKWEYRLEIRGVGFRAESTKNNEISMQLGFNNPVVMSVPEDIEVDIPSNTEIVLRGINKQRVGQIANQIRSQRPPHRYSGKGVRYAGEVVQLKTMKKDRAPST